MWWFATLLLYGSTRPRGTDAGRALVVRLFLLLWLVLAVVQVVAWVWPW